MANLTEMTAQIIAARAAKKEMTKEELQDEMKMVFNSLKTMEEGKDVVTSAEPPMDSSLPQKIKLNQYFKKDHVVCAICNKEFTMLKRHLLVEHQLKPGEYRKKFGIPSKISLAAKSYVESRRQFALDKGLGAGLAKARADKKASVGKILKVKTAVKSKAITSTKKKPVKKSV